MTPAGDPADWLARFQAAIRQSDVDAALAVLAERSTAHAGTPSAADKRRAGRALLAAVPDAADRWALARRFVAAPPSVAAQLACDLIVVCYPQYPEEALRLLRDI